MTAEQVNVPMYEQLLLSEWIAGHPDLHAALERGVAAAEVGPGGGTALRILARRFPASRFVGFDIDSRTVTKANERATADGLANLRFETVDASALPKGAFDLVFLFDAFHHMTDPDGVLEGIRSSLAAGGSLLLAEAAVSGDATTDAADPTAVLLYGRTSSTASRRARRPATRARAQAGRAEALVLVHARFAWTDGFVQAVVDRLVPTIA